MTLRNLSCAFSAPLIIACAAALSSAPAAAAAPTPSARAHVAAEANCPDATLAPDANDLPQIGAAVVCLLNAERANAGLPALALNPQLTNASQPMADRMVAEQFFSHDTPDGGTLIDRIQPTGYLPNSDNWVVGENLAWGNGVLATPQAIVDGWMNSAGHRANILADDYRDIGLGLTLGSPIASSSGGAVYVTDFGKRGASAPARLTISVSHAVSSNAKRALTRGLTFRAACSRACKLVGRLFLHSDAAQAAGLEPAAGSLKLTRAGHGTFKVRLTARAKQSLRRLKHLNMTLVTTASGTGVKRTTRVTLT